MLTTYLSIYFVGFAISLIYLYADSKEQKRGLWNIFYALIWVLIPISIVFVGLFFFIAMLINGNEDSDTSA
jgi:heme/copper-type cytochrome/quinol oxidase subunit 2